MNCFQTVFNAFWGSISFVSGIIPGMQFLTVSISACMMLVDFACGVANEMSN